MTPKPKAESKTIKQPLVEVELPPRRSRHGREQVMLADFLKNPGAYADPDEPIGIRVSNRMRVAAGPTQKKGLKNHGVSVGIVPDWWKQ